ncbi:MAG: ABC transporter permease [Thermoplasmata archaeon]|nr:ABC transporter permease [Thermoplasmata archaeon]
MRYALGAIRRRPGRSAATAFGIGLATALVVVLLALSSGIQSSASRLAASSGVDLLATSANTTITSGTFPSVTGAHRLPSAMESADPNVVSASPWLVSSLTFGNQSLFEAANASAIPGGWAPAGSGAVGWIPSDNQGIETPATLEGAGFTQPGDPLYANGTYQGKPTDSVVLDSGLASILHARPGSIVWASAADVANRSGLRAWYLSATAFRVVGISGPFWLIPSALLGFFYLSELQVLLGGRSASSDYASLVLIHLHDTTNPSVDRTTLAGHFPGLTVFTLGDILGAVQNIVDLYRTFGTFIGAIGVCVATLFATTVLLMSVDDRSRELALLRAVGFSRARVGALVAEEGVYLALMGLCVGLLLGGAGAYALNRFLESLLPGLPAGFSFVSFDPSVIASGVVEVLLVGLIASALPALRAMRLPISEELRAA